jgi:uncharacterized protein (TIGR02391 family)
VFLIATYASSRQDRGAGIREHLIRVIKDQLQGRVARVALLGAALRALDDMSVTALPVEPPADASDVLAHLWWSSKFESQAERTRWWREFERVASAMALVEDLGNSDERRHLVSAWELGLLYEAVCQITDVPDPVFLFDLYPLHPRIKAISGPLFQKGEYFSAVFEASKALNDFLRAKTGSASSEITLARECFGDPTSSNIVGPKIQLNPLDPTSTDFRSQQNEQRGFSQLAHGIFYAFRHPKGHEPQDTTWGQLDAARSTGPVGCDQLFDEASRRSDQSLCDVTSWVEVHISVYASALEWHAAC